MLANFRQVAGEKPLKINPLIGQLIDPEVVAKMVNALSVSSHSLELE